MCKYIDKALDKYRRHRRFCLFDDCKPVMSWELEKSTEYEKFRNMKVVGVTDILCDTYYEAVNIVVE